MVIDGCINDRQKITEITNQNRWFYSSFAVGGGFFKVNSSRFKGPGLKESSGACSPRKKKKKLECKW